MSSGGQITVAPDRGKEANIRARVMYCQQVGYYAMGVQESQKERHALTPYYQKVLTGREA